MTGISSDLREMGYERSEKESPFEDGAMLWTDGTELVCEETAIVIGGDSTPSNEDTDGGPYKYPNSDNIKLVGGFFSPYFEDDGIY